MKVTMKNLGTLKQAEISLGDLTISCGENNSGKTYAAHVLYDFLNLAFDMIECPVSDAQIEHLLTDRTLTIGLGVCVEIAQSIVDKACEKYTKRIGLVIADFDGMLDRSEFHVRIRTPDMLSRKLDLSQSMDGGVVLTYFKRKGEDSITFGVNEIASTAPKEIRDQLKHWISRAVGNVVFFDVFPTPLISSSDRTGTIVFRDDFFLVQKFLHDRRDAMDSNATDREIYYKSYHRHPRAISDNVAFICQLNSIAEKGPFLAKKRPDILEEFEEIIGGTWEINQYGDPYYTPKGKNVTLRSNQCSGAVRSLLHLGLYLRHVVCRTDLLMIDEPELNLHPATQRRIARLLARLVNLGVKVFITTHSDYIIKELNTLIMLNQDKPHLKSVAQEYGYRQDELIDANKVKAYMTKKEGDGYTLAEARVNQEFGIEARSFDDTMDEMKKIQRDIAWGPSKTREGH